MAFRFPSLGRKAGLFGVIGTLLSFVLGRRRPKTVWGLVLAFVWSLLRRRRR